MVQSFYYENWGKCCKKLMKYDGFPNKILMFPYEGWAQPASLTYWVIKTTWWSTKRCKIIEVSGTKKRTTKAKIKDAGKGTMQIKGTFKDELVDPDFRVILSTQVSSTDFQLGYSMTGTLERGEKASNKLQMTHYAMIKRKGY
ncbi:unnamed protein product [Owenia fusiformis]|uniref:Uncharacterized protein n=1 Tax=Owenia fusiformis TaxID=6347 RepID=A0A8J1XXU2_OWEFU|nr:unnamed protein product [Owenia fusiformis]